MHAGKHSVTIDHVSCEGHNTVDIAFLHVGTILQLVGICTGHDVVFAVAFPQSFQSFAIAIFGRQLDTRDDQVVGVTSAAVDQVGQSQRRIGYSGLDVVLEARREEAILFWVAIERHLRPLR